MRSKFILRLQLNSSLSEVGLGFTEAGKPSLPLLTQNYSNMDLYLDCEMKNGMKFI